MTVVNVRRKSFIPSLHTKKAQSEFQRSSKWMVNGESLVSFAIQR